MNCIYPGIDSLENPFSQEFTFNIDSLNTCDIEESRSSDLSFIRTLMHLYSIISQSGSINMHINHRQIPIVDLKKIFDKLISRLASHPIEIIEKYANWIIGYYIIYYEKESLLSSSILYFIKQKARTSLKFSHLCFWNLLSCKNIYKKYIDLSNIVNIMEMLMNEWEITPAFDNENAYVSIMNKYETFDQFCKNNLLRFNETNDLIKNKILDKDRIDLKVKEIQKKNLNKSKTEKWKLYVSNINFINDMIIISDLLKQFSKEKRNENLYTIIDLINETQAGFSLYNPFHISNMMIFEKLNKEYSFSWSTKDHVPYHLLIELSDNNYRNNNWDENIARLESQEENFKESSDNLGLNSLNTLSDESIQGNNDNNDNNNYKQNITTPTDNKPTTVHKEASYRKYFSIKYHLSNFVSMFSCGSHINPEENDETKISNLLYNTSRNNNCLSTLQTSSTPDSIGLFGSLTFSQISKRICLYNDKRKHILPLIVKGDEDLRQDLFVSQVINIFWNIFKENSWEILFLQPLNIQSTGRGGIIETIVDTVSLMKINEIDYSKIEGFSSATYYIDSDIDQTSWSGSALRNYYLLKYGGLTSLEFDIAVKNFAYSLAAYSLLWYFLEIKDRNNGNILINDKGNIIHIDFGFLLSNSPGNVNFEKAPFKLTSDFVELLQGIESEYFKLYLELFFKGFIALRRNYMYIIGFMEMYMATNYDLSCFKDPKWIIEGMRNKFFLKEDNERNLKTQVELLVYSSLNNWRTQIYDKYQKFCVGIN